MCKFITWVSALVLREEFARPRPLGHGMLDLCCLSMLAAACWCSIVKRGNKGAPLSIEQYAAQHAGEALFCNCLFCSMHKKICLVIKICSRDIRGGAGFPRALSPSNT